MFNPSPKYAVMGFIPSYIQDYSWRALRLGEIIGLFSKKTGTLAKVQRKPWRLRGKGGGSLVPRGDAELFGQLREQLLRDRLQRIVDAQRA